VADLRDMMTARARERYRREPDRLQELPESVRRAWAADEARRERRRSVLRWLLVAAIWGLGIAAIIVHHFR
jgi:hypothetical protein